MWLGLGAADLAMHIVLPELDGRVLAGAIAFKEALPAQGGLAFAALANRPEQDRIALVADRIAALVRLQRTPRSKRRIAVLMPDYPGQPGRTAYAVGLDVPASVTALLTDLGQAGYCIEGVPATPRELLDHLKVPTKDVQKADAPASIATPLPAGKRSRAQRAGEGPQTSPTVPPHPTPSASTSPPRGEVKAMSTSCPDVAVQSRLTQDEYEQLFRRLPVDAVEKIKAAWGDPAGDPDMHAGAFRFRARWYGNVLVALPPDRGSKAGRRADYHDPEKPPRHALLAFGLLPPAAAWAATAMMLDEGWLKMESGAAEHCIYLPSFWQAERSIVRRMKSLLARNVQVGSARVESWLARYAEQRGVQLSEEQRLAIQQAAKSRALVLTGGPGTGKTTTLRAMVQMFEAMGKSIALASPTGRAAQRLAEVTGREAKTIHRLLEFDPSQMGFRRNEESPLEADVIIIDESSMIDVVLANNLLKAVDTKSQLILVGDVDQLPSVGPGTVLRDFINSGVVPVARLNQVFRQAAESLIIQNAHRINRGEFPALIAPGTQTHADAVHGADRGSGEDAQEDALRDAVLGGPPGHDDADEGRAGADGQVELAGDEEQGGGRRDDADDRRAEQDVQQVVTGQEVLRLDREERHEEDEDDGERGGLRDPPASACAGELHRGGHLVNAGHIILLKPR